MQLDRGSPKKQEKNQGKEVTRMFLSNPSEANTQMAEAGLKHTEAALEEAFKALLGAAPLGAQVDGATGPSRNINRFFSLGLAFLLFTASGATLGVGGHFLMQTLSVQTAEQALFAQLEADTESGFLEVIRTAQLLLAQDTPKEAEVLASQALAHYLLWRDHLDGYNHLERAAEILESLSEAGQNTPYGLLVRSYFQSDGATELSGADALPNQLDQALAQPKAHPYVFLAAALLEPDPLKKRDLLRDGLVVGGHRLPRLQHTLAALLHRQQPSKSAALLRETVQDYPNHLRSHFSLAAMQFQLSGELPKTTDATLPLELQDFFGLFQSLVTAPKPARAEEERQAAERPTTTVLRAAVALFHFEAEEASAIAQKGLMKFPDHPHLVALDERAKLTLALPDAGQALLRSYPRFDTPQVMRYGPVGTVSLAPFQAGHPFRFAFDANLFPEHLLTYMTRRDKAGERGLFRRLQNVAKKQEVYNALLFSDFEKAANLTEEMEREDEDRPETHLARLALDAARGQKTQTQANVKKLLNVLRGEPESYMEIATTLFTYGHDTQVKRVLKVFAEEGFASPWRDRVAFRMSTALTGPKPAWSFPLENAQEAQLNALKAIREGDGAAVAQRMAQLEQHQALLPPAFLLKNPTLGWPHFFHEMNQTPDLGAWVREAAGSEGTWTADPLYQLVLGKALKADGKTAAARNAYEKAKSTTGSPRWVRTEAAAGLERL